MLGKRHGGFFGLLLLFVHPAQFKVPFFPFFNIFKHLLLNVLSTPHVPEIIKELFSVVFYSVLAGPFLPNKALQIFKF